MWNCGIYMAVFAGRFGKVIKASSVDCLWTKTWLGGLSQPTAHAVMEDG